MDGEFIKRLDFDSDTFEQMKTDMNFVLQRLLGNMQEKGSTEGTMTVKINVSIVQEWVQNYDPDVPGETRMLSKPKFKHKVTSAVQITDEKSGNMDTEMELDTDENGVYFLKPVANVTQRSIFDSDFGPEDNPDQPDGADRDPEGGGGNRLPGGAYPLLPGSTGDDVEPEDVNKVDGDFREVTGEEPPEAPESPETGENASDEDFTGDGAENAPLDGNEVLFGENGDNDGDSDDGDAPDDYEYDDPEE